MEKEISELKAELDELKAKFHFWKTFILILLIDIPLISAIVLNLIGIGEINATAPDSYYYMRWSSVIFILSSIFIMLISNLHLICKEDC